MAIKNKVYFLFFLLFLFSLQIDGQESTKRVSLIEIFNNLQEQHNIQFNYAEDIVKDIILFPPSENISLTEALNYLEENSIFSFNVMDANVILVQLKDRPFAFQNLSEVVLTPYIIKGINKISNGSYVIDFSQFDILPGLIDTDVLQSVQAFPGILSINETVSNINIRGGSHDQNLILWDGIKMYQSGHFFGLISMFNPQITQKVNLLKNGTNVALTDGVSGTISMHTASKVNNTLKGRIGVNFTDANGFADVPLGKKTSIQIAARKSISDFIETPTYSKYFDRISQDTEVENSPNENMNSNQKFNFYDTSLRWIYEITDKDILQVNFINTSNNLMFNENTTVDATVFSRESSLTQKSIAGAIKYNRSWNDTWQTALEIYETDYKLKAVNANILEEQRFLQENIVSETSVKLEFNYKLNERTNWLNGYHFVETEITNLDDVDNPVFRLKVSEVVRTHGLFSQLNYKSTNRKANLNFGFRYNYITKFSKHLLEPRLTFTYQFTNDITMEVLGEFKHQNTSQVINFQNDFLGIEKRRWQLSNNSDIPVLQSKQASVGLSYNKRNWLLSGEAYYKYVDGITTQSQGFQNQYEFVRKTGSYDVFGLDFLLRKQIKNFNAWLSYSYMKGAYEFASLSKKEFPSNLDITHSAILGTAYTLNRLKISSGLNWHSGKPTTRPVLGNETIDNNINFNSPNSSRLKDYLRVDVSALYNFKLRKSTNVNFGISVWNVLNKKNQINDFYRLNNETVEKAEQNSLGLTPNVVLRVHF